MDELFLENFEGVFRQCESLRVYVCLNATCIREHTSFFS